MNSAELSDEPRLALTAWRACQAFVGARDPIAMAREVSSKFRGSRADLEQLTWRRLQAAVVLLFLAARCVHLGQAGIDLALASHTYTVRWLALALGVACLAESAVIASLTLGARQLTWSAILTDAVFGAVGLAVMAIASSSGPGRAGSLNWMLPYTVATATGLGALCGADLVNGGAKAEATGGRDGPATRRARGGPAWALGVTVALAGAYVTSAYLPHRLAYDRPGQIWSNAAYYLVFFAAAAAALGMARLLVDLLSARNAEVEETEAEIARQAQWRAVSADVFDPTLDLLARVIDLADSEPPASMREEARRLISMIDAVQPSERSPALNESKIWEVPMRRPGMREAQAKEPT